MFTQKYHLCIIYVDLTLVAVSSICGNTQDAAVHLPTSLAQTTLAAGWSKKPDSQTFSFLETGSNKQGLLPITVWKSLLHTV